jgi:hypothetical protein
VERIGSNTLEKYRVREREGKGNKLLIKNLFTNKQRITLFLRIHNFQFDTTVMELANENNNKEKKLLFNLKYKFEIFEQLENKCAIIKKFKYLNLIVP